MGILKFLKSSLSKRPNIKAHEIVRRDNFKLFYIDIGFCRVLYSVHNDNNEKIYYCFQDEGDICGGVKFYRMTSDGEPQYEIKKFKIGAVLWFEIPNTIESDLMKKVCKYIENHKNMITVINSTL